MTHFVTLAYLGLFAPWLLLLASAQFGVGRRAMLLTAIALALYRLNAAPEELFSRALAADTLSRVALITIAGSVWRERERRELLAAFALTLVAAGNDILVISTAAVIATAAVARPRALPLLAAACAFAWSGETELALVVRQSPAAAAGFSMLCALGLPWQRASLIAATALALRLAALLWLAPAHAWILR